MRNHERERTLRGNGRRDEGWEDEGWEDLRGEG